MTVPLKSFGSVPNKGWFEIGEEEKKFPCILLPGYQIAAAPFGENGYFNSSEPKVKSNCLTDSQSYATVTCVWFRLITEKHTEDAVWSSYKDFKRSLRSVYASSVTVLSQKVVNTILNLKFV